MLFKNWKWLFENTNQTPLCCRRVPPRACWYTCWFTLQPKNLCQRDLGPNMCVCVCVLICKRAWLNGQICISTTHFLYFSSMRDSTLMYATPQVWLLCPSITHSRVAPNAEPTNAAHSKSPTLSTKPYQTHQAHQEHDTYSSGSKTISYDTSFLGKRTPRKPPRAPWYTY